jgi:hypothetical protein
MAAPWASGPIPIYRQIYNLNNINLLCNNRRTHVLQQILLMCILIIKLARMVIRVAMKPAESLLTLTRHVAEHQLLLTAIKLTRGHGEGF